MSEDGLNRRAALRFAAGVGITAASGGLGTIAYADRGDETDDAELVTTWLETVLGLVQRTPGYSPPVASRVFGYVGVTMYEALWPAWRDHQSLAGQLDGLRRPPAGRGHSRSVAWPLVANHAVAGIVRHLFPDAAPMERQMIDDVQRELSRRLGRFCSEPLRRRSRERAGGVVAEIAEWSRSDGGHHAHRRNVPPDYLPPVGPGLWEPTPPAFGGALQPTWGRNRPFVPGIVDPALVEPPHPYSELPGSPFHSEAVEVYDTVNRLTDEQRAIAAFWSDDPGATATPPGHSVSILVQALRATDTGLRRAADVAVRLGVALSDAFICCWETKYRYNVLRPITYVRRQIDPNWGDPLPLVTPPFPEYTSGHSVQSGAAATVLTERLGELALTDRTHEPRGLPLRDFTSFWEAAEEAAISRVYGGIHYRRAIEQGLAQGVRIGDAANQLRLRRH